MPSVLINTILFIFSIIFLLETTDYFVVSETDTDIVYRKIYDVPIVTIYSMAAAIFIRQTSSRLF